MKVGNIAAGMRVFIEANKDNATEEWETRVCELSDEADFSAVQRLKDRFTELDFCFLEPIFEDGMIVDFGSKDVVKHLMILRGVDPYAWRNVKVFNVSLPVHGRVHAVAASTEEVPHNRRGSYRVKILKSGELSVGNSYDRRTVTVNDISATGIGLVVSNMEDIHEGTMVRVNFFDENRFDVRAVVRRIKPISTNNTIVGCEFERHSDSIAQFVNMKQVKLRKSMTTRYRK